MIFTILISIVFIAEVIIAITIFQNLIKLDKAILELDETINSMKSSIKEIAILINKITVQWKILANDLVEDIKQQSEVAFMKHLLRISVSLFLLKLNFKFIKKIKKTTAIKFLVKSWSFIENMV